MFFRSRNGKESAEQSAPAPVQQETPQRPPDKAPPLQQAARTSIDGPAPAVIAAPTADKSLPPEELKKRAEVSQRLAATMGRIVRLMAQSPRHRDRKLADLQ